MTILHFDTLELQIALFTEESIDISWNKCSIFWLVSLAILGSSFDVCNLNMYSTALSSSSYDLVLRIRSMHDVCCLTWGNSMSAQGQKAFIIVNRANRAFKTMDRGLSLCIHDMMNSSSSHVLVLRANRMDMEWSKLLKCCVPFTRVI